MMCYATCFLCALALLLTALFNTSPSDAVDFVKIITDYDNYKTFEIKSHVILHCEASVSAAVAPGRERRLEWSKDGQAIAADDKRYKIVQGENKLIIERSVEDDAGNYTCRIEGDPTVSDTVQLVGKPMLKMQANTAVVEGEKLKIICTVVGKPTPVVEWLMGNETYNTSRDRVELSRGDNGVLGAVFLMREVGHDDVGNYTCRARNAATKFTTHGIESTTVVRVKDRLAALWPFIGICLEAVVLGGIILLYERKRTMRSDETVDADDTSTAPSEGAATTLQGRTEQPKHPNNLTSNQTNKS